MLLQHVVCYGVNMHKLLQRSLKLYFVGNLELGFLFLF